MPLGIPPMPPPISAFIIDAPDLPPSFFIILAISWYCLTTRLTSWTDVPDPAAMRLRRDAFNSPTELRSFLVIDRMIASCRRIIESSMPAAAICFCIFPSPGSMPMMPPSPPIF